MAVAMSSPLVSASASTWPWLAPLAALGAVVVALAALVALRPADVLNALAAIGSRRVEAGVAYGPLPRHKLDVYAPATAAPAGGRALVVFFYGGSWNSGERRDYRFVGEAFASRGVLALVADYRLYPEVRYPDFLGDCALALAHGLREAARLNTDPQRVFVMGHSAGAYTPPCWRWTRRGWPPPVAHPTSSQAGSVWPAPTTSCR